MKLNVKRLFSLLVLFLIASSEVIAMKSYMKVYTGKNKHLNKEKRVNSKHRRSKHKTHSESKSQTSSEFGKMLNKHKTRHKVQAYSTRNFRNTMKFKRMEAFYGLMNKYSAGGIFSSIGKFFVAIKNAIFRYSERINGMKDYLFMQMEQLKNTMMKNLQVTNSECGFFKRNELIMKYLAYHQSHMIIFNNFSKLSTFKQNCNDSKIDISAKDKTLCEFSEKVEDIMKSIFTLTKTKISESNSRNQKFCSDLNERIISIIHKQSENVQRVISEYERELEKLKLRDEQEEKVINKQADDLLSKSWTKEDEQKKKDEEEKKKKKAEEDKINMKKRDYVYDVILLSVEKSLSAALKDLKENKLEAAFIEPALQANVEIEKDNKNKAKENQEKKKEINPWVVFLIKNAENIVKISDIDPFITAQFDDKEIEKRIGFDETLKDDPKYGKLDFALSKIQFFNLLFFDHQFKLTDEKLFKSYSLLVENLEKMYTEHIDKLFDDEFYKKIPLKAIQNTIKSYRESTLENANDLLRFLNEDKANTNGAWKMINEDLENYRKQKVRSFIKLAIMVTVKLASIKMKILDSKVFAVVALIAEGYDQAKDLKEKIDNVMDENSRIRQTADKLSELVVTKVDSLGNVINTKTTEFVDGAIAKISEIKQWTNDKIQAAKDFVDSIIPPSLVYVYKAGRIIQSVWTVKNNIRTEGFTFDNIERFQGIIDSAGILVESILVYSFGAVALGPILPVFRVGVEIAKNVVYSYLLSKKITQDKSKIMNSISLSQSVINGYKLPMDYQKCSNMLDVIDLDKLIKPLSREYTKHHKETILNTVVNSQQFLNTFKSYETMKTVTKKFLLDTCTTYYHYCQDYIGLDLINAVFDIDTKNANPDNNQIISAMKMKGGNKFFLNYIKYGPITDIISVSEYSQFQDSLKLGFMPLETRIKVKSQDPKHPLSVFMGCRGCSSLKLIGHIKYFGKKELREIEENNKKYKQNKTFLDAKDDFAKQLLNTQIIYRCLPNFNEYVPKVEAAQLNEGMLLYETIDLLEIFPKIDKKKCASVVKVRALNFVFFKYYGTMQMEFHDFEDQPEEKWEEYFQNTLYNFYVNKNVISFSEFLEVREYKTGKAVNDLEADKNFQAMFKDTKTGKLNTHVEKYINYLYNSNDNGENGELRTLNTLIISPKESDATNFIPLSSGIAFTESTTSKYKIIQFAKEIHKKPSADDKQTLSSEEQALANIEEDVCSSKLGKTGGCEFEDLGMLKFSVVTMKYADFKDTTVVGELSPKLPSPRYGAYTYELNKDSKNDFDLDDNGEIQFNKFYLKGEFTKPYDKGEGYLDVSKHMFNSNSIYRCNMKGEEVFSLSSQSPVPVIKGKTHTCLYFKFPAVHFNHLSAYTLYYNTDSFYKTYNFDNGTRNEQEMLKMIRERTINQDGWVFYPIVSGYARRKSDDSILFISWEYHELIYHPMFIQPFSESGFGGFSDYYEDYRCKVPMYKSLWGGNFKQMFTDDMNMNILFNKDQNKVVFESDDAKYNHPLFNVIETDATKYNEWVNLMKIIFTNLGFKNRDYWHLIYTKNDVFERIIHRVKEMEKKDELYYCTRFKFFFPIYFRKKKPAEIKEKLHRKVSFDTKSLAIKEYYSQEGPSIGDIYWLELVHYDNTYFPNGFDINDENSQQLVASKYGFYPLSIDSVDITARLGLPKPQKIFKVKLWVQYRYIANNHLYYCREYFKKKFRKTTTPK